MRPTRTIVVAGGGIAGLTAALALAGTGFRAVVLEQAPAFAGIGAGVQLTPNAGRLLARLGLEEALAAAAAEPAAIDIRSGLTGRPLASLPLGEAFRQRYRVPYRVIHRAALIDILAAAARDNDEIELHLDTPCREFAAHANGITALGERNGRVFEVRGAALIAADGIRSRARAAMPKAKPAVPSGRVAWRSVLPADRAPELLRDNRIGLWLGPDAHLVHYTVDGGRTVNLVAIVEEAMTDDGWSVPGDPAVLAERFAKWSDDARAIVAAPPGWVRWRLDTVDPGGRWVAGPVALIGDAAHAMLPFLAQGAAMAIEDAMVVARELAARKHDPVGALERYSVRRHRRVRRVWNAAKANGERYHMAGYAAPVRDIALRLLGGNRLIRRFDWLYGWNAE